MQIFLAHVPKEQKSCKLFPLTTYPHWKVFLTTNDPALSVSEGSVIFYYEQYYLSKSFFD